MINMGGERRGDELGILSCGRTLEVVGGVRSSEVHGRRRCVIVGGSQALEVCGCRRCKVCVGFHWWWCSIGGVGYGWWTVPLVVVGVRFCWWWSVVVPQVVLDGRFMVVVGGSIIVVLYIFCRYKFHR